MDTKEFIEKIEQDEELNKCFKDVNNAELFYSIAKENGLTDDFETMKSTAKSILQSQAEVNETDLEALVEISGGMSDEAKSIASIAVTSVGVATATAITVTGSGAFAAV